MARPLRQRCAAMWPGMWHVFQISAPWLPEAEQAIKRMGEWTLEGDLSRLFPWLWLGQWLHVGKNATMGMGRYEIQTPCQ